MRSRVLLVAAVVAAAALVGGYVAAGGGQYKPLEPRDPCRERPLAELPTDRPLLEQLALSALDGAACALRVTREELALAIATPEERSRFAREHHIGEEDVTRAVRRGLDRAVADARRTDRLSGIEGALLEEAAERLPVDLLVSLLSTDTGGSIAGLLEDLVRGQVP